MSIQLTEITARYRSLVALDQVNLHVRPGDCYGFIGHNGAGKTTALRIALGLVRPEGGRVTIGGIDASRNPRVRALVGGLIEQPGFHDNRSGPGNLRMLAGLQGIPASDCAGEMARVLDLVGLADVGNQRVGQYSQGMRQRLGLAQALLGRPDYLILDEPTNGLDPQGIHELRRLLLDLAEKTEVTILLSSHLLDEVAGLCNRVGVLHRGRRLVEASTEKLLAAAQTSFRLRVEDRDAAVSLLTRRGLTATDTTDGALRVQIDGDNPADIVASLVDAECRVHSFAPAEVSLEEIYLEYARGDRPEGHDGEDIGEDPAEGDGESSPTRAATGSAAQAVRRVATYEVRRLFRPGPVFALTIPSLLAPLVVYQRHLSLQQAAEKVESGAFATTTSVTAFEALGRALQTSTPLLALLVAGLASQSLAGELAGGTLRNVVLRPLRRIEIAAGKLIVLSALTVLAYVTLVVVAALSASVAFEYGDLVELLATGATFPHLTAEEVWPELWPALASPVLPLLGFTALGFLGGSIARSATGALALTLGTITALELSRGFARAWQFEAWLLGPYLPSPLANTSHLHYFVEVASGVSREEWEFAAQVPAIWWVTCCALAGMIFHRKYVP